jgi:hypothetical protein
MATVAELEARLEVPRAQRDKAVAHPLGRLFQRPSKRRTIEIRVSGLNLAAGCDHPAEVALQVTRDRLAAGRLANG